MNKIKVIHSVKYWLPQTQTWLFNQINFMSPEIENHVVCEGVENLDQFPFKNIHYSKNIIQQYVKKASRVLGRRWDVFMEKTIRDIKPHIIHSHFGNIGWANSNIAKKYDLKHVVTFYGLDVNRLPKVSPQWKNRYHELFEDVNQILCEGPHMAKCIQDLGCPASKICIHRIGISLDKIAFKKRKWNHGEKLKFLAVGGFREKKGIPYAFEALGILKQEFQNFEVTVIGDARSKEEQHEKQKIIRTIKKMQLEKHVKLLGLQPYNVTLNALYDHHIFLAPSLTGSDGDTEGGAPVTIIEAAASGMPVISTRHCDIPNVLGNINAYLLVQEKDAAGLANAIRLLMQTDWEIIAEDNRCYMEKNHNIKILANLMGKIYHFL